MKKNMRVGQEISRPNGPIRLVMIGDTQSGKTTFAASLSDAHDKDLRIEAGPNVKEFLNGVREAIQKGTRLDATQTESEELSMTIRPTSGEAIDFRFRDVRGEDCRRNITNLLNDSNSPNGAILLLNPETEVNEYEKDPAESEKRKNWWKEKVLPALDQRDELHFVALVKTAKDVYDDWPEDKKDVFDAFKDDIVSYINTKTRFRGDGCEEFSVKSYDASKKGYMKFAGANPHEPVLWLIKKIKASLSSAELPTKVGGDKTKLMVVGIFGLALVAVAVMWLCLHRSTPGPTTMGNLSREIAELHANATRIAGSESELSEIADWLCTCSRLKKNVVRQKETPKEWSKVDNDLTHVLSACLKKAVEEENLRNEIAATVQSNLEPSVYGQWKGQLDEAVAAKETESHERVKKFIDEQLRPARSTTEAIENLENFYSDNGNVPGILEATQFVHERVGQDFKNICAKVAYAPEEREYFSLRELVNKVLKSKKVLGKSCWYKFALDCRERGQIDKGVNSAFSQEYELTRIDVQIVYDKFPFNFRGVKTAFEILGTSERWDARGVLKKDDNKAYRTVWEGRRLLYGNPWRPAGVVISATDMNAITRNITKSCTVVLSGGAGVVRKEGQYVSADICLDTQRKTGDKNPEVKIFLYVKGRGVDLKSLLPRDEKLEP